MKILIFGGTGMLGHRLWLNLNNWHETWVTIRRSYSQLPNHPSFPRKNVISNINAISYDDLSRALSLSRPDIVINCIGLVKQHRLSQDILLSIQINALLPHRLALLCKAAGIRLIHISTDCVFSGKKGQYLENDLSDAEDIYGRTKFLGEVAYPNTVTLRTSIVGRELNTKHGLIEWFLTQKNTIYGFRRAIFSGFTTDEISRIIIENIVPNSDLSGIYHVSSDPISKYDLLMLANKAFNSNLNIIPDDRIICDRSLNSSKFRKLTGYVPPIWISMMEELASSLSFYDQL